MLGVSKENVFTINATMVLTLLLLAMAASPCTSTTNTVQTQRDTPLWLALQLPQDPVKSPFTLENLVLYDELQSLIKDKPRHLDISDGPPLYPWTPHKASATRPNQVKPKRDEAYWSASIKPRNRFSFDTSLDALVGMIQSDGWRRNEPLFGEAQDALKTLG